MNCNLEDQCQQLRGDIQCGDSITNDNWTQDGVSENEKHLGKFSEEKILRKKVASTLLKGKINNHVMICTMRYSLESFLIKRLITSCLRLTGICFFT